MSRVRITATAVGLWLGIALAMSTSAEAARSWKVGELVYMARTVNVSPGGEGSGYLPCGTDTDIVGGGLEVSGPPGSMRVNGLVPDGVNDAWFGFVDVFGSRDRAYKSFGICSRGDFDHVVQPYFPVAAGEIGPGVAICEAGAEVVGGGAAPPVGYGESRVIESSAESATKWAFSWRNTDDGPHAFSVQATCKQGWDLRRVRATKTVKPQDVGAVTASCRRSEHVVGGGARILGDDAGYLVASRPVDSGDKRRAPDDRWRAVLDSASGTSARIEALAICRR